jgi:lipid II:glycine glycyltransferase (peptidoglycan interpeptide bridge formation enzyme)
MNDILVLLTKSQAENLMEFFEVAFITTVRDTPEIDNLDYLADMCEIYKQIKQQYENAKERGLSLDQCVSADDIIEIKEREEKCGG